MPQTIIILCMGTAMSLATVQRSRGKDATVAQVHETLQNLMQSIQDEGQKAERLYSAKQKWCSTSMEFEAVGRKTMLDSLEQLRSDLKDHEASVDEAAGTIRQIQAEMELTGFVINRTHQVLQSKRAEEADSSQYKSFLQARGIRANISLVAHQKDEQLRFKKDEATLLKMLANKKQQLASMQAELEAEYPLLAQVQDLASQTKQRIADRSQTLQASSDLASISQEDCQKSSRRGDAQVAARAAVTNSIETALYDLEATGVAGIAAKKMSSAISLVQVDMDRSQITDSDVLTLWPHRHARKAFELLSDSDLDHHSSAPPLIDSKPKIKELMVALKSESKTDQEQTAWCIQEHDRNELQLKLKQDAVGQLNTEIAVHADVEAQLSDELESIDSRSSWLQKTLKDVQAMGSDEKAYTKNSEKEHQLAVRILDQAMAVLEDFGSRAASEGQGAAVVKGVGSANSALRLARSKFAAQKTAMVGFSSEVQEGPEHLSQAVTEALHAQQQERVNIELAKDSHISKRTVCEENLRMRASEMKEAQAFMQQLQEECSSKIDAEEERRRKEQIQALQDVQKTLDGQDLPPPPDMDAYASEFGEDQDTPEVAKAPVKILTPMERAAQEMGVSED